MLRLSEEGWGKSSKAVGTSEVDGGGAFCVESLAKVVEAFRGEAQLYVGTEDGVAGEGFVHGDVECVT